MHTFVEQLIQTHRLDHTRGQRLWRLSGLYEPPARLYGWLQWGLALVAAVLLGAGLIFFVAANWQTQTRSFKLTLLEGAVLTPALLALCVARARSALLLLATLTLGALLAFVGQTYQTGADAWQLFALWALLALPWSVLGRSDWLWALWVLIAGVGIAAWSGMLPDRLLSTAFHQDPWDRATLFVLAALLFVWPALLPALRLLPQARARISWAVAALHALSIWVLCGLADLFNSGGAGLYAWALTLVLGAMFLAWRLRPRDYVVLGLALLAADTMLLGWLAYVLFDHSQSDWIATLLFFTLAAAATLGGSGTWLYRLQRTEADA